MLLAAITVRKQANNSYRNSLYFRCENILREYNLTMNIFLMLVGLRATHQHFRNCCCPYILVYVVASNTTSNLL